MRLAGRFGSFAGVFQHIGERDPILQMKSKQCRIADPGDWMETGQEFRLLEQSFAGKVLDVELWQCS